MNDCYFLCRNKHHGNYADDDDDSNMEANFDDIMKEEKRRLESLSNFI
jgi:protein SPT2